MCHFSLSELFNSIYSPAQGLSSSSFMLNVGMGCSLSVARYARRDSHGIFKNPKVYLPEYRSVSALFHFFKSLLPCFTSTCMRSSSNNLLHDDVPRKDHTCIHEAADDDMTTSERFPCVAWEPSNRRTVEGIKMLSFAMVLTWCQSSGEY
jgi:hypothetical protein